MKRGLVVILCFVFGSLASQVIDYSSVIEELKVKNDYLELEKIYGELIEGGIVNAKIYEGLAGTSFKNGKVGKARLNIEKARLLAPNDQNINELANLIVDEVDTDFISIDRNWFVKTTNSFTNLFSPSSWLIINLLALSVLILGVLHRLRIRVVFGKLLSNKGVLVVALVLFFVSLVFGFVREKNINNALFVVSLEGGMGKISASGDSPDSFAFKAGDVFTMVETTGQWTKVITSQYDELWVEGSNLGLVKID